MQPYQFKPGSARLVEQADGTWAAEFELAAYQGQGFGYADQGINADNLREIDVNVLGNENPPVAYDDGTTAPFQRGTESGVELVAKKDGKRKGSTTISYL